MALIDAFEKMLAAGKDAPLLRFSLGNEYLKVGQLDRAVESLRAAVALDPEYSAAWKALGKALADSGLAKEARDAYDSGIAAAEKHGDKQAAKEMGVFRRRLEKIQATQSDQEN